MNRDSKEGTEGGGARHWMDRGLGRGCRSIKGCERQPQRFGSPAVSPGLASMKWYHVMGICLYLQTMFDYNVYIEIYYLVKV